MALNNADLPALPAVVIGGYLGAGKTTLVNHLLRQAGGRRVAVLVNDFGDINIDADLIEGADAGVLSLAGGCLCCSFGDDLPGTLGGLRRRATPPDVVLIELSGVALPAAVVRSVRLAPGIDVAGTLVVADAADIRRQVGDRYVGETVQQQLRDADWVLVNKTDLLTAPDLQALLPWLAAVAPAPRWMACPVQAVPAELVLGWRAATAAALDDPPALPPDARFAQRAIGTWPRTTPASGLFTSHSVALPPGTDLAALGAALAAPGSGVLRAKGLLPDPAGTGALGWLLQVAGGRWQVTPAAVSGPGRLVLIALRGPAGAGGPLPPAGGPGTGAAGWALPST